MRSVIYISFHFSFATFFIEFIQINLGKKERVYCGNNSGNIITIVCGKKFIIRNYFFVITKNFFLIKSGTDYNYKIWIFLFLLNSFLAY